jgi:hypothetical protein
LGINSRSQLINLILSEAIEVWNHCDMEAWCRFWELPLPRFSCGSSTSRWVELKYLAGHNQWMPSTQWINVFCLQDCYTNRAK